MIWILYILTSPITPPIAIPMLNQAACEQAKSEAQASEGVMFATCGAAHNGRGA